MKNIFIKIIILIILFSSLLTSYTLASQISVQKISNINDLTIYSNCILLMEKNTGDILYEKNSNEKMYPASTTKILTAILVLENCNLNDIVTVDSIAIKSVPSGYKTSNIMVNEKLTIENLLYTMLIPSANDAANALAIHISGSISGFADLMNEKAKELGCSNSHFTNPSGIHDENHYSTANDLSLIARYAMNIDKFGEIVKETEYTLPSTDSYSNSDRAFVTTNRLLNPSDKNYYYEYTTGIKTGYTSPAGDCLVASAKKGDIEFIIVVLGSSNLENGLSEKYLDCKTLFDFAFDNYTTYYTNLQQKNKQKINFDFLNFNVITVNRKNNMFSMYRKLLQTLVLLLVILTFILIFKICKKNSKK